MEGVQWSKGDYRQVLYHHKGWEITQIANHLSKQTLKCDKAPKLVKEKEQRQRSLPVKEREKNDEMPIGELPEEEPD